MFQIHFLINGDVYKVRPLPAHPEVAHKAIRFHKLTPGADDAVYDVRLTDHGPECDCKGYLRWQKPCKHIRTLLAAGMI